MDDGHHRMIWMNHYGYPGSKKIILFNFQCFFYRIRKLAVNCREIYASLFENIPVLNYSGTTTAAAFALPYFFFKMRLCHRLTQAPRIFHPVSPVIGSYLFLTDHQGKWIVELLKLNLLTAADKFLQADLTN